MRLNKQLQQMLNNAVNPLDDSCLKAESLAEVMNMRFMRLAGSTIRFNGNPQIPAWRPEVMNMWYGIHKALEAGFHMYIGIIPCFAIVTPVVVLGVGHSYDKGSPTLEGIPVAWVYDARGGGNFIEIDVSEEGMPIPMPVINFGFQPCANNIEYRLVRILGSHVVELLKDADGELKDVFEEMVDLPDANTSDYRFWLERIESLQNILSASRARERAVIEKYEDLRGLVASRIQRDGSKYMFKAKHFVDLPRDFADKLMPHLNTEGM